MPGGDDRRNLQQHLGVAEIEVDSGFVLKGTTREAAVCVSTSCSSGVVRGRTHIAQIIFAARLRTRNVSPKGADLTVKR